MDSPPVEHADHPQSRAHRGWHRHAIQPTERRVGARRPGAGL